MLYKVVFDSNGGSEVLAQSVPKGTSATAPTAPFKEGYIFSGWYADSGFVTVYDFTAKVAKDITLYAKWTEAEKEPEWINPFTDVSDDDWFYEYVKEAEKSGFMNGTGNGRFDPDGSVTRAMFITVLYRLCGSPEADNTENFTDVNDTDWYSDAVKWGYANGIVKGISDTEYAPDIMISREQMAAMLYRYANYKDKDTTQGGMLIREFADFESITEYAVPAMTWCVNNGIINGTGKDLLEPQGTSTRAQASAVIVRAFKAMSAEE